MDEFDLMEYLHQNRWMPTAFWQVSSTPASQVDGDLDAVMLWLKNQSDADNDRIAIMGFCFGGGTAIRYSVNAPNIRATAVFYGTPISDVTQLKRLNGPVLGIFGGADKMIPQSDVDAFAAALTDAGIRHEISVYPDMPHAFVKGMEEIKQGGVQEKAWNQLRAFIKNSL
jgi:carboxymethylenebutenolidase